MADVFISYAREDRDWVSHLARRVEALGYSVWWDLQSRPGLSFDQQIEAALREAKAVIVVWSRPALDSRWVRAEASEGFEREILLPVLRENVRPPMPFRQLHASNLAQWPRRDEAEFEALCRELRKLAEPSRPTEAAAVDASPPPRGVPWLRVAAAVLLFAAFAGAGGYAVYSSMPGETPVASAPAPAQLTLAQARTLQKQTRAQALQLINDFRLKNAVAAVAPNEILDDNAFELARKQSEAERFLKPDDNATIRNYGRAEASFIATRRQDLDKAVAFMADTQSTILADPDAVALGFAMMPTPDGDPYWVVILAHKPY